MNKFILASTILLGLNNLTFAAQPPSVGNTALAAPIIVDSTGKTVGKAVPQQQGTSIGVLVNYQSEKVTFALRPHTDVNTGALLSTGYNWSFATLAWVTNDCTGQAYISLNQPGGGVGQGGTRWALAILQGNQWTGYISSNGAPQVTTYNSYINGGICFANTQTTLALPVVDTISLDGLGIAPFYLK